MLLGLLVLIILTANWIFSNLFGFWPDSGFHGFEFLLKYGAIAVIIILFSWGFGD